MSIDTSPRPTSTTRSRTTRPAAPSEAAGVWLVAEREIGSKLRSKAFLISTAILFVLALAGLVFGGLAAQNQSGTAIAVTADPRPQLARTTTPAPTRLHRLAAFLTGEDLWKDRRAHLSTLFGFAAMTRFTERLEIGGIPEQFRITLMLHDVIDIQGGLHHSTVRTGEGCIR